MPNYSKIIDAPEVSLELLRGVRGTVISLNER
jgi:hypothetical protein